MNTVSLLQEKNHFLEKFYSLNEKQLLKLSTGNFDNLNEFYNSREDVLKIIKYIDNEISKSQVNEDLMGLEITVEAQNSAKEAMRTKDIFVARILEQDVQILSLIDRLKNEVIKELRTVRTAKKAMAGYKAGAA